MNEKFWTAPNIAELYSCKDLDAVERTLKDWQMLKRKTKTVPTRDLHIFGEKVGFMSSPTSPKVISLFVSKGGVLKTTLTLNFARLAALHGIRTCVIGLDMQGDITSSLGFAAELENHMTLNEALQTLNSVRGLFDYYSGHVGLTDVIISTDLPHLDLIPETPELIALEQDLIHRHKREFWLKDKVVEPLKKKYDLIILDCSPNWNRLITNALVASDALISPLECKINNFRNFRMFEAFIQQIRRDLDLEFRHLYVPTRYSPQRKLSREILEWYQQNLPNCIRLPVREHVQGEEAMAMHVSVGEYAPRSEASREMAALIHGISKEIFNDVAATKGDRWKQGYFTSPDSPT